MGDILWEREREKVRKKNNKREKLREKWNSIRKMEVRRSEWERGKLTRKMIKCEKVRERESERARERERNDWDSENLSLRRVVVDPMMQKIVFCSNSSGKKNLNTSWAFEDTTVYK